MSEPIRPENSNDQDARLFKRLEESLNQIELDEMMKGFSDEELATLGYTGESEVPIDRKVFTETTEREKLSFKEGVEYKRLPDHMQFTDLTINDLLLLRDVHAGMLIATREANETIKFNAGKNVEKTVDDTGEKYIAKVTGKVVIIKDAMFVFSSDIDCSVKIRVGENKMKVLMDCVPGYGNGSHLNLQLVMNALNEMNVIYGIKKDVIQKTIETAEELMLQQSDVIVAEGTEPISGEEGRVEYQFDTNPDKQTFLILPDGRIDYKGAANIAMAKKDQLLAIIKDPGRGVDGVNVAGEIIPPERSSNAVLIAGSNVRSDDDGRSFYAEIKGCIMLNPPVIEVLDLYEVRGDVDYTTGNINFNGNVIINGTVREGFEVKAEGDIVIANCVESARVIAGRDVRISGGILGQGKGLVSAGRDVYVEYIQNGRVEAQGTLYVNDFAVNSYIFCNHLDMLKKHGSVVGGEIYSQRGIDVQSLGSASGTKTYVTAGTDYLVKRKIEELDEVIKFCSGNLAKIDTTLKPVLKMMKSDPKNPACNVGLVKKTLEKRKELQTRQRVMQAKRDYLQSQLEIEGICFVKVKNTCYEDVYITIKNYKTAVTHMRQNVLFYEDPKEEKIKVGAY